jgi:3-hydroxymyristoyl/3-hydroxydecanoyl-(acyl carrier protein) dehydratase
VCSLFGRSESIPCTEGTLFGNSTPKLPSPALLAFDEVKFLAEVTPQDEEILYRIDVRKHNREQKLLLAAGRVVAGGTERATIGSLLLVVLRQREPHH